jgi:hypothetical protein
MEAPYAARLAARWTHWIILRYIMLALEASSLYQSSRRQSNNTQSYREALTFLKYRFKSNYFKLIS